MCEEQEAVARSAGERTAKWKTLAAASLAGVLALPLAYLHNQPSLVVEMYGSEGFSGVIVLDAAVGAVLASLGARLSSRPLGPGGSRFLWAWGAAFLSGCTLGFGANVALFYLDGHGFYSVWNALFTLLLVLSFASAGIFYSCGTPVAASAGLRRVMTKTRWVRLVWLTGAALVGGSLTAFLFFAVVDRTGAGDEGAGLLVMLVWPYFSWGAGLGAGYVYSRCTRSAS